MACSKNEAPDKPSNTGFALTSISNGNKVLGATSKGIELQPEFIIEFDENLSNQDLNSAIQILDANKSTISSTIKLLEAGKKVSISPTKALNPLSKYEVLVKNSLKSNSNSSLKQQYNYSFNTAIVPSDKL